MKFTTPNDVFANVPMDNVGISQYAGTVDFVNQVTLGERTVTLNGARLKVKRVAKDLKINRRATEANRSNPMIGKNLLDKTNVTQLRTQALIGGTLKYLTNNDRGPYISGIKVGGDNFHRHFNDDGVSNAGYGSGYNVVGRPSDRASYLSDKLLELADPILMTNLPYLQPNGVWPSTQIDLAPYPTSISSRIGTDLNIKMTSANIPGKEISDLIYRIEMNDVRLNVDDFPRLDINPNKNFGPFEHKYAIFNFDGDNEHVELSARDRDKTTAEKIDYGVLHRMVLGNYNERIVGRYNSQQMHDQLPIGHNPREANRVCYPICENFKLSNAHFRIQYNQYSPSIPETSLRIGGATFDPFKGLKYTPGIGDLGIGSNYPKGKYLPRYMCLWAIEGDNNYVEIDLDYGGNVYVNNVDPTVLRYLSLVGIRGTGNVVVIRLRRELKFYGNPNSDDGAVAVFTMTSNHPDKNVVYILGPKNQNISESIIFNEETFKNRMRRTLFGCIEMDLQHSYWEAQQADQFKIYDKYYTNL